MTQTPKPKPQPKKVIPPQHQNNENATATNSNKPYQFVSFPREGPHLEKPAGHDKFKFDKNQLHGTLCLKLHVQTSLHVSTGIVAPGSDIGSRVALIKTMTQGTEKQLLIQGSSLKGCIRSVYEAITNSTLGIITRDKHKRYKKQIPEERQPRNNKNELCPASRVFGALDWQGLIEFNDAKCESIDFSTGFMPSLYRPRPEPGSAYFDMRGKVAGRKFYYHTIRAIEKGQNQEIAVQQAAKAYTFTTQLQFKNLQPEELGTLLVILGQDNKYPIALKVGAGKPIGMGTMTVEITQARVLEKFEDIKKRYCQYNPTNENLLTGNALQQFIQKQIKAAHSLLIQSAQLQELAQILHYPTDREPPEGMY
ncbi:RAMP superfamily CRISPR-associated protein [Calothrix sp. UHCC 0171]|uniref:RAMP superfamily CRISPR-associated protein n=1 Tax=Calothrix sp. UHCC 0171 TaxID=3110245 RepID=UPI002B201677|nr:RAMP superfamily CRISPR-associated protein [Calothrix sp. UHCC 0171]MEA5573548.1 RAMP superfamily CRISPR-associated protein [Calothrix sp. UHCC 0171]